MIHVPRRVVFDCNVFLQALGNAGGPSGRCVAAALQRKVLLFISGYVLEELQDVATRPEIAVKFRIPLERVDRLILNLQKAATPIADVLQVYVHPVDPDDSHYVNLALAADAELIVSRDRHLLNLTNPARKESQEFFIRFPRLRIVDPVQLLAELACDEDA